ncbi:MAG: hypothetical protein M3394_04305, partial [Actinomycetota bacterium]|nr:hypothetical protein [Actinomycetota bacterium]
DPDREIVNLSAESQGYGARVSYVGGAGSAFTNYTGSYALGQAVAPGSRHAAFARTRKVRLAEQDVSGDAIAADPDGAFAAELSATGQQWPYELAHCTDLGTGEQTATVAGARAHCNAAGRTGSTSASYESNSADPKAAPVQRASSQSSLSIDAAKGVTATVTSSGSFQIPGIVKVGKVEATATVTAAGKDGTAKWSYSRKMEDVEIAGQPFCSGDCDPQEVADAINAQFTSLRPAGILVVASLPNADQGLLSSDGGAQAIVQRDVWDHEEDLGIHDGGEDRFELPAFVVTVYQDRKYPQHEVYWLAGVQAAARLPRSLADRLPLLGSTPGDITPTAPVDFIGGPIG